MRYPFTFMQQRSHAFEWRTSLFEKMVQSCPPIPRLCCAIVYDLVNFFQLSFGISFPQCSFRLGTSAELIAMFDAGDQFRASASDLGKVAEPFADATLILLLGKILLDELLDEERHLSA